LCGNRARAKGQGKEVFMRDEIIETLCMVTKLPLDVGVVILTCIGLVLACLIPRKIMVNQLYADLVNSSRSPEIGGAMLRIFYFYTHDCQRNVYLIKEKYRERYDEEIDSKLQNREAVDFSGTLHFQRRLLAQYFWYLALLRYKYKPSVRISKKQLGWLITENERHLIKILLHMVPAAKEVFEDASDVPEPTELPEDEMEMNRLLYKLYEETEE
jgi:hypothetical protein